MCLCLLRRRVASPSRKKLRKGRIGLCICFDDKMRRMLPAHP